MLTNNNIREELRIVCGIIAILGIMLLSFEIAAAVPVEEWNRTFSFGLYGDDYINSVQQTTDSGYIMGGRTSNPYPNNPDISSIGWLKKTDNNGSVQWSEDFIIIIYSSVENVQQTMDGGYVYGTSFGANHWGDYTVEKIDTFGNVLNLYSSGSYYLYVDGYVQQTTDSGYIITEILGGPIPPPSRLIKIDETGNEQWNKTYSDKCFCNVQQTVDGGFIIRAFNWLAPTQELMKTDAYGNVLWNKSYNFNNVRQNTDGGYILIGSTTSSGAGGSDAWLIKTDALGNHLWNKTFGGTIDDYGEDIQQTTDGGYIIAGWSGSTGYTYAWVIKTDSSGNQQWKKTFGGDGYDYFKFVQQTTDGGYIVAGHTNSYGAGDYGAWLVKVKDVEATITVDDSGGADFTSIQAAVDAASEGDTIEVRSGTYVENVDVGKRLTLIGEGADVVTVTAASSLDHVFEVTADYVNISGFTATGASESRMAGFWFDRADHCNISENTASNSYYGIKLDDSSDNTLASNIANSNGDCGIRLEDSSDNLIYNNYFNNTNNTYDDGNNQWDSGSEGNYYSDYVGTDSDGDGIGDTPYPILGGSSVDRYPLMNPWTASPLSGKIAFASSRDGNQEVYVMNANGSGDPINLINRLDADDGDPTWSPDGTQIAFSSNRSGNWTTYIMNADGSDQVCLLEGVYDAWGPAWSPDGMKIAVAIMKNPSDDFEIYTVDIQSQTLTQVTDNSDTDCHPSWSPDSRKVVFTSYRDSNHEIYVADLLADTQTKLTDDPAYDDYPEWSPDGSMIAFVSERDGNLEIYSMDIASKAITRLTYDDSTDKHAQWSPDGQNIIFVSNRSGDMDVYVMKANGTSTTCLVDWEGNETHPTWSPDHSSPPAYSVGQGAPDLAIKNHFIDAYNRNGGIDVLGSPTTEVHRAWGYLVQEFPGASDYAGGKIMYNPYKNYAYYIHGAIWERYYNLGGPTAVTDESFELGPPTSDIEPYVHTQDPEISSYGTEFRYQKFEGGSLEQNLISGMVYEVHGAIYDKWKQLGYASSGLGMPTTDEKEVVVSTSIFTGRYSEFEGGIIHWIRELNQVWVIGLNQPDAKKIMDKYYSEGGSGGWLGFPVTNDYINPSGYLQCDFEGGYITTTDGVNYEAFEYEDKEPPTLLIKTPEYGDDAESYRIEVSGSASDESGMYCIIVNRNPIAYYNTDIWKTNVELQAGENKIIVTAIDKYHNSVTKAITVYYNPDFSFAHITDVHIDYDDKFILDKLNIVLYSKSMSNFIGTLREVNDKKPAFILNTGDCVEYDNKGLFTRFMNILNQSIDEDIDIYHTAGNHDRRSKILLNTNLVNYNETVKNRGPFTKFEDDSTDYYFMDGGYLFIGFESGEDFSQNEVPPFTPEGSGLQDDQMKKLNEILGVYPNIPKIIFMHHPAINNGNDKLIYEYSNVIYGVLNNCTEHGGNDACIARNRCEFIDNCTKYNVQLVLTGHTHEAHVFAANGVELVYLSHSSSVSSSSLPYFIQTPSATKDKKTGIWPLNEEVLYNHGYRIVDITNGNVCLHPYTPTSAHPKVTGTLNCPAHIHAYDSQGRHTGLNASGDAEIDISDSFYIGRYNYSAPNEFETILLYNTTDEYWFEIVANLTEEEKNSPETESFNFTVEQEREDMRTTIIYLNVPLTENTTATLPINLTTTAYTMEIDHDGDGATDETRDPNFTETNYAPTAAIISPETGSIYNAGEPIEFNGTGQDPEDGILTNFSLVWYSDMNGVIGAGERFSTANLTPGMHMITLMINDSVDLVDTESVMITVVDRTSPSTITNPYFTAGTTWINWTWTNPSDPDFNHTELYLNGTFITNIPAPQNYYNITGLLPDTSYELSTRTVDTSGNINETWVNATARTLPLPDTTPPIITFIPPTDPGDTILTTRNWTFINVSLSEPGFSWLEWNGINESMSGSGTHWYINKTGLDNGVYTYCVWANDSAGNVNVSETRTIEIDYVIDTLPPVITITSPVNDTTYNTDSVDLNYSVNEPIVWQAYSLDGSGNITLDGNTILIGINDGLHTLTVYANDTSGNMNSSTIWFTIDTTPPAGITNLQHTAGQTWINWTWLNPPEPDFNHTEIYLNGAFQTLTSAEFFNATGLIPNTEYKISTKTADNRGNINETWVNDTALTHGTPPVSNASGPYTGIEGQVIIFNASASYDPDPGDNIVSFEWDFNNDGATDATGMEVSWTWNDDHTGQVNLTVTDSHGESSTDTTSVNVLNAPPEVEAGNDQTVNEGDTVSFTGDFTDPGTGDTHTIEWNFGDGTPGSPGTLEPTHVYADNGTYTVTLTVTDDDGASTSDTLNVTVENVAPIVDAGVDQMADEGDIVSFVGSFADTGTADTHLIEWDFGDATPISSGTLILTHTYADNGTYAVNLTVTDDDGASTLDTLIVTVNNVAPVLDECADETVQWGDTITFSRSFTDPGDDFWTAEIDWGDGSQEEGILSSKIITATHVYSIPGEYIYTLTVLDDDGGVGSGDMQITVTTRATELEYIGVLSAQYSDYIDLKAQLNDPGNNNPLPDRSINFILGTQTATATTGPDGIATTSFKLDQPAGSYDVKAEFAGDDSYSPDNDTKAMQISKEDTEITYTGDTILPTTAGSIYLRATLEEIDTDYGDLTKINVNFTIYKSSDLSYSNPIATIPSIASISVTSSGMGVGTATATIDNLPEDDYMIMARIVPNNYYLSISSNPTPMIVYEPTDQFTTGGGWIWDPTGSHGNFGFNVKYNKNGKVKGNSIYVYRLDRLDYIVKSNVWIGLAISDNTSNFQGKAVLQIFDPVTGELQPESSGNFQFTVEAMDNELNGNPDYYTITVLDKDGLEYHNATGSLEGGNIVIHDKKSK